jgi:23S rRNA pseudouridine1911/1915/1917 synthase
MKTGAEHLRVEVPADAGGDRVDRFLSSRLGRFSRSRIQALIRAGCVRDQRGTIGDPSAKVKQGDVLIVDVPAPEAAEPAAQTLDLSIVYEDADLIVIDKPAGLVVHPAPGHPSRTLVNALLAHCGPSLTGIGGVRRPGIVHRLDKDTTGLLVVAKTAAAHASLTSQFAAHGRDGRLSRSYIAFAWGAMPQQRGIIDAPLGRSERNRTKIAVVRDGGRRAVTRYEVIGTYAGIDNRPAVSELKLTLETGRTHQIRVHLAYTGHPLLGDKVYGTGFAASARRLSPEAQGALERLGRQALHAAVLAFEHPVSHRPMRFESRLPQDLADLKQALGEPIEARRFGTRASAAITPPR